MLTLVLDHQVLVLKLPITKAAGVHSGFLLTASSSRLVRRHRVVTGGVSAAVVIITGALLLGGHGGGGGGGRAGFCEGGRRAGGVLVGRAEHHVREGVQVDRGAGEVQLHVAHQLLPGGAGVVAAGAAGRVVLAVVPGVSRQSLHRVRAERAALAPQLRLAGLLADLGLVADLGRVTAMVVRGGGRASCGRLLGRAAVRLVGALRWKRQSI